MVMSDRIAIMHNGRIEQVGPAAETTTERLSSCPPRRDSQPRREPQATATRSSWFLILANSRTKNKEILDLMPARKLRLPALFLVLGSWLAIMFLKRHRSSFGPNRTAGFPLSAGR